MNTNRHKFLMEPRKALNPRKKIPERSFRIFRVFRGYY